MQHATPQPKVVIVGAGMSGLLMGIRLKRAGIESFEILEKASSIGGTWRDNTYPGLSCDVPAYMYAYSFEPNPECSHRYARGSEIQEYFTRVCRRYNLMSHIRFNIGRFLSRHPASQCRAGHRAHRPDRAAWHPHPGRAFARAGRAGAGDRLQGAQLHAADASVRS